MRLGVEFKGGSGGFFFRSYKYGVGGNIGGLLNRNDCMVCYHGIFICV